MSSSPSYKPKFLSIAEILEAAGFKPIPSHEKRGQGWELQYKKNKRLHAQQRLDEITLHKDVTHGGKHYAEVRGLRVAEMMKRFQDIDEHGW